MADLGKLSIDKSPAAAALARRRRQRRLRAALAIGAVLALAVVALLQRKQAPLEVEFTTVSSAWPTQSITLLNATGRLSAARKASVSAKATGRLEWLGVEEGSRVKAGQLIARLEALDVLAARDQALAAQAAARANLGQAQAELVEAQRQLHRQQELFAQGFISQAALDTAASRVERIRAQLASLEAAIEVSAAQARSAQIAVDQTLIRAPFDGVILTKNANVGDIITPFSSATGTQGAVVTIADLSTLEVEADVAEASIGKIAVGMPAEITLDALPELRLMGRVSRIVPTVDRSKATVLVKVALLERDPRLLPEMSARVAFLARHPEPQERKPVTVVRKDALVEREGQSVVFRVVENQARAVAIARGRDLGELVEVSGLAPGERIVAKPPRELRDGQPLRRVESR
ncbi:MAG: efflux RND transporter periplasmic adaptor subunit [Casimicrobiaceae bacterium]|nr:efflux RND transporter periplasmic adaptor subunit [Casimicrobiaceae bacterium]